MLRIPGKQGTTCLGAVTDLRTAADRRWVVAEFPPPGTPILGIGDDVPLEFTGASLGGSLCCRARVSAWTFNEAVFTYGFEVDMPTKESLLSAIHRNRARRVGLSAETPVEVSSAAAGRDEVFVGRLHNISVGGVALTLEREADEALKSTYELRLRFELPACEGVLDVLGKARSRILIADRVRYGIQFAQPDRADLAAQLRRIERFVAAHEGAA